MTWLQMWRHAVHRLQHGSRAAQFRKRKPQDQADNVKTVSRRATLAQNTAGGAMAVQGATGTTYHVHALRHAHLQSDVAGLLYG
jgi:hypothetical protein